ncbi:hypothetical protein FACS1894145_7010 [Bacteroidia bacterium]|nr:hypothetical protein FACS1894145_7010 [Bacteroidia bacterium]
MYKIEIRNENESREETMKFINSKQNWNVETQSYRNDRKGNLSDYKIYWRGNYLIIEHDDIIHHWDSFPYCFLKQAVEFMELDKPKKWKTLDKLINLRMAIRQTEVNWCGYVDDILVGRKMTLSVYREFMLLARANDYMHHGSHTF